MPKQKDVKIPDNYLYEEKEKLKNSFKTPSLIKVKSKPIQIVKPNKFPDSLQNKEINLSLKNAKVEDLPFIFSSFGVVLIPTSPFEGVELNIHNYKGTLKDFMMVAGSLYNLSFSYEGSNIIAIEEDSNYVIVIPQEEKIAEEITTAIGKMGATDVSTSLIGGTVSYRANVRQNKNIESYIKRFSDNAAMIGLEVAIVTVNLERDIKEGFDWQQFGLKFGDIKLGETSTPVVTPTDSLTGDPVVPEIAKKVKLGNGFKDIKALTSISSSSTGLELLKGDLTFSAVFDYLSTYGKTTTNQSVMLKGLNGLPLSIRSGKSIPFIKDVSSNTTTGGSTSDTSKSAKVETIETGIELEMNPYYDVENQITSVSVKLDLVTLLGFIELEAGNDTTLSQPSTQDQSFESYVKLRLGESTVMGGVTFESVGDKRNSLSFIDNLNIAHRNEGIEKNAIFILIRPTITVYGDFEKDIEIIK
jgi:hypothetical protein